MATRDDQFLCCRVGREWYGLAVANVVEVLHFVALHDVPVASPHVLGLMTLRDVVMPVIDLRILFAVDQPSYGLDTPIIATTTEHGPVGVVVDDVDDVQMAIDVSKQATRESPFIWGTARTGERLLLLLDVLRLRESAHA